MKKTKFIILFLVLTVTLYACAGGIVTYDNDYDISSGVVSFEQKEIIFNVASFNIQGGKLNEEKAVNILNLLKNNEIAVAGLQEMDQLSKRTDKKDFMSIFKKEKFTDGFFAPTNTLLMKDTYGIATLSEHYIDESHSFLLPYPFKREDGNVEKRVVSRILTKIDGVQIAFYNTHLSYENITLDDGKSLRQTQIEYIVSLMNRDPSVYKILTGDFNVESFNEYDVFSGYKIINNEVTNYQTYRDEAVFKGIDNIIYSTNLKLVESKMIDSSLSDHNPLNAKFKTII